MNRNRLISLFSDFSGVENREETPFFWLPSEQVLAESSKNPLPLPSETETIELARAIATPKDWESHILSARSSIAQNAVLGELYSLAVFLLTRAEHSYNAKQFRFWPDPAHLMPDNADCFYLLVSLACVDPIIRVHGELSIPSQVTEETLSSIGSKALDYFFHKKKIGTLKWALWWFQHHMQARLFRIGRLEFMLKRPHTKNPYFAQDAVLCDIHIPGGGGLTWQSFHDSCNRALSFFETYSQAGVILDNAGNPPVEKLPRRPLKIIGFESISWIYSPDLVDICPPNANLVQLGKKINRFPVQGGLDYLLPFVFGTFSEEPVHWAENTNLQRSIKKFLLSGRQFRISGMVIFVDDLIPKKLYNRSSLKKN